MLMDCSLTFLAQQSCLSQCQSCYCSFQIFPGFLGLETALSKKWLDKQAIEVAWHNLIAGGKHLVSQAQQPWSLIKRSMVFQERRQVAVAYDAVPVICLHSAWILIASSAAIQKPFRRKAMAVQLRYFPWCYKVFRANT